MPFIAEDEEEDLVTPLTVTSDDLLACPVCEAEMTVREAHYRDGDVFIARHFVHDDENAECPGESDSHLRMKAIAASKLKREYPNADIHIEYDIGDKIADVVVEFSSPREPLGNGIAVEVQHRNRSKNREKTTGYYLANGYSVLWLEKHHFRGKDVRIDHIIPVWPAAVKHADYTENYPDVFTKENDPVQMLIPLPEAAKRITAAERKDLRWHWLLGRINSKRGDVSEPSNDGSWNEAVTTRLGNHGELSLLETPDGAHVFQFRKTGIQFEDADIGVRLDNRIDIAQLVEFALAVDSRFRNASRASSTGHWKEIEKKGLGGGQYHTKWILFSLDPQGRPALKLSKKDPTIPDIPIRIERDDIETLFEFIAEIASRSHSSAITRASRRVMPSEPHSFFSK